MAESRNLTSSTKTIALTDLKPNEYQVWIMQCEITLEVYKCWDLVLGKEKSQKKLAPDSSGSLQSPQCSRSRQSQIRSSQRPRNLEKTLQ